MHSDLTASQFAWSVVADGPYAPPAGERPRSARCWLCGGPAGAHAWPRQAAIPPSFTNQNLAAAPDSDAVCEACAALLSKETWEAYVRARPERGLKTGHAVSWRNYSHVFAPGLHACPGRAEWREWLLDPPGPPFVFVVSLSGQKHLIFRARVAHSRDAYPVQMEEETVYLARREYAGLLDAVEALLALGARRESVLTGRYSQAELARGGAALLAMDEPVAVYRLRRPAWVQLAVYCARKEGR